MARKEKNFKDWFDLEAAKALGAQIACAEPRFDARRFTERAAASLDSLEMMERVRQFAAALHSGFAEALGGEASFGNTCDVLKRSLPPILPDCDAVTDGWLQWPVGEYVAQYGVDAGEPIEFDATFELMVDLTQRFSAEFAIRPFVIHAPARTFARIAELVDHPSSHVRRLCSEGIRPRLPWGARIDALVQDPAPIFPILRALEDDSEEYVRRSVANCLNDVSKDHPAVVVETCARLLKDAPRDRERLAKHALRTLVKAGDRSALAVLGYTASAKLDAVLTVEPAQIRIGESVTFELTLTHPTRLPALIDLRIDYVKANGARSPKVFKWSTKTLGAKSPVTLTKAIAFVPRSIRKLYPGRHGAAVLVNGAEVAHVEFDVNR